ISAGRRDRTPRILRRTAEQMLNAVLPLVDDIIEVIMSVLNQTPPELAAEILRKGIFVTGGSMHIPGLHEYLEQALELPITILRDLENAVAAGGAKFFDNKVLLGDMLGIKLG
ncbi:MAG: rod shape-determining protein, partial [Clostridia bacterium]|nr:rod shape-determining protein [Clostridia bacterium]